MRVDRRVLQWMAALVWYSGGLVLLFKGTGYILAAAAAGPGSPWPWVAALTGVTLGLLRGRTLFTRACRRNLDRIDALEAPRAWQFFRPAFFPALGLMIAAGALLSRAAAVGVEAMLVVAALELTIAVALLTSSREFWRRAAGRRTRPAPSTDPAS